MPKLHFQPLKQPPSPKSVLLPWILEVEKDEQGVNKKKIQNSFKLFQSDILGVNENAWFLEFSCHPLIQNKLD